MLTEFGKFARKLRIDRNELLIDMANKLGVSPAFLSAVEVGKKNVPEAWKESFPRLYDLDLSAQESLINAIENSVRQIKINLYDKNDEDKELILSFARKLQNMNTNDKNTILRLLKK